MYGSHGPLLFWNPGCPSASTKMQCDPGLCPDLSAGAAEVTKEGSCKNSVQMRRLALVEKALKQKININVVLAREGQQNPVTLTLM